MKKNIISIVMLSFILALAVFYMRRWPQLPDEESLSWHHAPMVYSIGMMEGDSPLSVTNSLRDARNPVLTASDVTDVKASFVADPFMVRSGNEWHMFFEVLNITTGHGDIGTAVSRDGGRSWSYGGIVLDEPFHLSYPYVFEWQGKFYMIPESAHGEAIRLYEASGFPGRWAFVTNIVDGVYVDPTVFRSGNRWWLMAGIRNNRDLFLFHSGGLEKGWEPHPFSPVVRGDPRSARSGGRVVFLDGCWLRFAQDCVPVYGTGVNCFRVNSLSDRDYSEEKLKDHVTGPGIFEWARDGMHHIDPHERPDGSWMACVDGWVYAQPDFGLDMVFRNGPMLLGAKFSHMQARAGERVKVIFFWKGKMSEQTAGRVVAFAHFRLNGRNVFQVDYNLEPGKEVYEIPVRVPTNAPAGSYDVVCGLYDPVTHRRYRVKTLNPQRHSAVTLPVRFTVDP